MRIWSDNLQHPHTRELEVIWDQTTSYFLVYNLPQDRTGQDRTGSWQLSQFLRCFLLKRAYPTCERQNYSGCFFFAIPLTSPPSFSLSLGSDRCPNRLLGKPDRRPQSQRQQKSLPLFHPYPASTTIGFNHLLFSGQKCKLEPPSRSIGWEIKSHKDMAMDMMRKTFLKWYTVVFAFSLSCTQQMRIKHQISRRDYGIKKSLQTVNFIPHPSGHLVNLEILMRLLNRTLGLECVTEQLHLAIPFLFYQYTSLRVENQWKFLQFCVHCRDICNSDL